MRRRVARAAGGDEVSDLRRRSQPRGRIDRRNNPINLCPACEEIAKLVMILTFAVATTADRQI